MWTIQQEKNAALFWLKILMYAVCAIHVAYFHFNLAFCNSAHRYKWRLFLAYLSGAVCLLINFFGGFMDLDNVRSKGPFLYWPHAMPLLWLLIAVEIYFVTLSFYIVLKSLKENEVEPMRSRLKIFLIASVIAWIGGMTNWIPFFDAFNILPIGNICVSFYLAIAMYLIFKYDLLQLNLAIRRTFIYGLMTLFITLVYILFIILFEKAFQSYFGYSSVIAAVLASLIIAVLFNPFRNLLVNFLDKKFFGKNIADLSTENDQMRFALQKQDQMKAVAILAAGMAHEIKNPLTAIRTFTEYLPAKSGDTEFVSKFTKVVGSEIEKIDLTVRQLLNFAKPSAPIMAKVDLQKILNETLDFLNVDFLKHKIALEKKFLGQPAYIHGDRKQLGQAFLNIFLNSIQAMPNGGTLTISTSLTTDYRLLTTIQDTGEGISKENLKHIFDPFFTTKDAGTGLGLAIVHGIIRDHGGRIEVQSEFRKGTEFKIYLKKTI